MQCSVSRRLCARVISVPIGAVSEMSGEVATGGATAMSSTEVPRKSCCATCCHWARLWNADWKTDVLGWGVSTRVYSWKPCSIQVGSLEHRTIVPSYLPSLSW